MIVLLYILVIIQGKAKWRFRRLHHADTFEKVKSVGKYWSGFEKTTFYVEVETPTTWSRVTKDDYILDHAHIDPSGEYAITVRMVMKDKSYPGDMVIKTAGKRVRLVPRM